MFAYNILTYKQIKGEATINLDYYLKNLVALEPCIAEDGGKTTRIYAAGGETLLAARTMKTVLNQVCHYYDCDPRLLRRKYGELTLCTLKVPLPLSSGLVLIPVKMKLPAFEKDIVTGYINVCAVNKIINRPATTNRQGEFAFGSFVDEELRAASRAIGQINSHNQAHYTAATAVAESQPELYTSTDKAGQPKCYIHLTGGEEGIILPSYYTKKVVEERIIIAKHALYERNLLFGEQTPSPEGVGTVILNKKGSATARQLLKIQNFNCEVKLEK